ncbi:unnamed protein product, partial [Amoebophrya sp. A25]
NISAQADEQAGGSNQVAATTSTQVSTGQPREQQEGDGLSDVNERLVNAELQSWDEELLRRRLLPAEKRYPVFARRVAVAAILPKRWRPANLNVMEKEFRKMHDCKLR